MTRPIMFRATCDVDGCDHVSVFTVGLAEADTKRLSDRILATADWLRVDGKWCCAVCSHALRERIGVLSTKQERLLFDAIQNAIHWRKLQVVG